MKIHLTSFCFNSKIQDKTATPGWASNIGNLNNDPQYDLSIDGLADILNSFEKKNQKRYLGKLEIEKMSKKRSLINYSIFDKIYVNNQLIKDASYILLIVSEETDSHPGRISLSYPPYAEYSDKENVIRNSHTIELIAQLIDCNHGCWFISDVSVKNIDELHFNAYKVSDRPKTYDSTKSRKEDWEAIMNDFSVVKNLFKKWMLDIHKVKNESTANEYLRSIPKVLDWFIKNEVCDTSFKIWDVNNDLTQINEKLAGPLNASWKKAAEKSESGDYGFMMASWNRWNEFLNWYHHYKIQTDDFVESFKACTNSTGLLIEKIFSTRFISSLLTKPFVILTGLSGSGKTKLAQAFAMWMSENKEQYALVPVGADWTNREPLLGYPNSLVNNHYVKPDTGVLDILLRAYDNYITNDKELAKCTPYFLILDEMNLSHVERYFADFLSTMESGDEMKLFSGSDRYAELDSFGKPIADSKIPNNIELPKNLFIIGTVNIDETTYMFSPKVLDRANTIEFRVTSEEMERFFKNNKRIDMDALKALGKDQSPSFMSLAARENISIDRGKHKDTFLSFFETLQEAGAEFGYRTANEMTILVSYLVHFGMSESEAYDVAIMQKLLPKLHGSRSKLSKVLPKLIALCEGQYSISLEKLERMKKNAEENGFASYAEA